VEGRLADTGLGGQTSNGTVDLESWVFSNVVEAPAAEGGPVATTHPLHTPKDPFAAAKPWARGHLFNLMPPDLVTKAPWRPRLPSMRFVGHLVVVLGLASVAYSTWTLWGTGLITRGEQTRLERQFEERLSGSVQELAVDYPDETARLTSAFVESVEWDDPALRIDPDSVLAPDAAAVPAMIGEAAPALGEPLGRIVIPQAGVDWIVVEGAERGQLKKGPGHIPGSAIPGQLGNAVISGHRTTNGAPFYRLDRLRPGDRFEVTTLVGTHEYEVVDVRTVLPTDTWVAAQWEGSWLTLTTCTPRYYSTHRLVVISRLVDGPNAAAIHDEFGVPEAIPSTRT
jgi:sortase A